MSFLLLLIVIIPLLALAPLAVLQKRQIHKLLTGASALSFLLTLYVVYLFITGNGAGLGFTLMYLPQLSITIGMQVTSQSIVLLLMTSIVFFAASMVGNSFIKEKERIYGTLFLILEAASFGVFLSSNLLLLYIFWEIAEVMMFFVIFIYGGYNRRYASIKFIMYSIVSSLLLLIGILIMYSHTSPHTFQISANSSLYGSMPLNVQLIVMILLLLSFMIKMPVFPFHSWLPDAHTEAPTTGSMILAGVLLKFGGYGIFLLFTMIPIVQHYSLYIAILFIISSIYSALVMLKQSNIKRMIAYSSIVDMGIIGVGLASLNVFGISGGIYGMLSHGLAISLLFLIAGTLDELYGTYDINKIKGVIKNFADISYLFVAGLFAAIGIPLTSGFIADILIFIGAFNAFGFIGLLPIVGIFLIGAAFLWVAERSFFNISSAIVPYDLPDKSIVICGVMLMAATIVLGVVPFLVNII